MYSGTLSQRLHRGATLARRSGHLALALVALSAGCDSTTASRTGDVRLLVRTTGGDFDLDGYGVLLDSRLIRSVFTNDNARLFQVSAGQHTLELVGLAANCTVSAPNPRTVLVEVAGTVDVGFDVTCVPTGILIAARTGGPFPPATHGVQVSGRAPSLIAANGSLEVSRMEPGSYTIQLNITSENCTAAGPNPRTVNVLANTMTSVEFDVVCTVPVRTPKIAFESVMLGPFYAETWITTVTPDGTGTRLVDRGKAPAWSPDGAQLVWSMSQCDEYYFTCWGDLVVVDPETRTRRTEQVRAWDPAWSPQGNAIAYTVCCAPLVDPSRLYMLAWPVGSMMSFRFAGVTEVQGATWSPDGERVAFQCQRTPGWDICTSRPDGTGLVALTTDHVLRRDLAWSPDGTHIAFTVTEGADRIGLLAVATGALTDLGTGSTPAWSPDGSRLVFAGDNGLFTMNPDGSNRVRLTTGPHRAPAWRP